MSPPHRSKMLIANALVEGRIVEAVKALHQHDVPEVIATPIVCGSQDYLAWISTETQTVPAKMSD